MTTSLGQRLQDHEVFILGELFPLIMSYARTIQPPNEVVIVSALLHLAAILKNFGLRFDTLLEAIDATSLAMYHALRGGTDGL